MDGYRAPIECDGGPHCQAAEHVEGCFATGLSTHGLSGDAAEVVRLQNQLAGAIEALTQITAVRSSQHEIGGRLPDQALELQGIAQAALDRLGGRYESSSTFPRKDQS